MNLTTRAENWQIEYGEAGKSFLDVYEIGNRNRYYEALGYDSMADCTRDTALKFGWSSSIGAALAVEALPQLEAEARKRMKEGGEISQQGKEIFPYPDKGQARDQAAEMFGTNGRYVSDAKRLKESEPDLFEQVKTGEKTIPQANREAAERSNTHPANWLGASNDGNRPDDDYTPTPPGATLALLRSGIMDVQDWGRVWEPCCGQGWMSEVLEAEGHEVYSSNLVDYGYGEAGIDFFACDDLPLGYSSIITNPPYKPKIDGVSFGVEAFIAHALSMPSLKRLALLLPTLKLQGQGRREVLGIGSGFRHLLQFTGRIKFHRGGVKPDYVKSDSPMGVHAWYVWDVGYSWRPEIIFIDEVV